MTKVLVLYYSTYGHIETMAYAVAEGVREAGAEAVVKRVPETVPAETRQERPFQARPARAGRDGAGTAGIRRHHRRRADPVRPHGRADDGLLGRRRARSGPRAR